MTLQTICSNMKYIVRIVLGVLILLSVKPLISAQELQQSDVPIELWKWRQWVLYDTDDRFCPANYNDPDAVRCAWPARLTVDVTAKGGTFDQEWVVFSEQWVELPYGADIWPRNVTVDHQAVPVMKIENTPSIRLKKGHFRVYGDFKWQEMPEMIHIPVETGVVKLQIDKNRRIVPVLDKYGRLWLQKRAVKENVEDRLTVNVFRLIIDDIPMRIITHLRIDVSGKAREVKLSGVILENSIPLKLESRLPARLNDTGELLVQVRPGRWEVELTTRFDTPVDTLGPTDGAYGREIWSFKPMHHLRMVKVTEVPSIEPAQTGMPGAWRSYAAYIIEPQATMRLNQIRRGDPEPAPDQLDLQRIFWLDFDGKGWTIADRITGTMKNGWRLGMNPPIVLGRVAVDGENQLITADAKTGKPGVEVRQGTILLTADSRIDGAKRRIPAVGWDHDMNSLKGVLHVPPGWQLLSASGVDLPPDTWFYRWTLLDFFIILIIAAAISKLRDWRWGVLALITMILIYHESGSPQIIWLHIIAAMALMRVLSDGKIKRLTYFWYSGAVIVLIIITIPFIVSQIRWSIYPQLKQPRRYYHQTDAWLSEPSAEYDRLRPAIPQRAPKVRTLEKKAVRVREPMYDAEELVQEETVQVEAQKFKSSSQISGGRTYRRKLSQYDPNALIQTGPGLPGWKWETITLSWNGPVKKDHEIKFVLMPPWMNSGFGVLRCILLLLMIAGLVEFRPLWRKLNSGWLKPAAAVLFVFVIATHSADANQQYSLFPPNELLNEFKKRLLEKPDCYPNCASFSEMSLSLSEKSISITLQVHALCVTAVPLPGSITTWLPEDVRLDQMAVSEMARDRSGTLWIVVPEGIHTVEVSGSPGKHHSVQIPLPLIPQHATFVSQGWDVQGIRENGIVDSGLQLTRHLEKAEEKLNNSGVLAPFLHVKRTIQFGLTWQVRTQIERTTPTGAPVVVKVPLLQGESVTTSGIHIANGFADVNMAANDSVEMWESTLESAPEIILEAPENVPWSETWILDAGPIWHCEYAGIPVIHHQDDAGVWQPEWRPWPGERLTLMVTRPNAVQGQVTTVDQAEFKMTPGMRSNNEQLTLNMQVSRGGQHHIVLPEQADINQVKVNGKSLPVRPEGRKLIVPLQPGRQTIDIQWTTPAPSAIYIKTPEINIGQQAVNAHVSIEMPRNRWILWASGPRLGPAVLFYSYLTAVFLAAILLGRIRITPLKTGQWILLSIGLTQIDPAMALVIAGWLLVLGIRKQHFPSEKPFLFNLVQVAMVVWTIFAMGGLYDAISRGLLGIPDMQISGNGSSQATLKWTQDRIDMLMPHAWVISLPKLVFNVLMLLWAIWLAFSLLTWLRWGWGCFSEGGTWVKMSFKRKQKASALNTDEESNIDK